MNVNAIRLGNDNRRFLLLMQDLRVVDLPVQATSLLEIDSAVTIISDDVVPEWLPDGSYVTGDVRMRNGQLVTCLQSHDALNDPNRAPEVAVSLWTEAREPGVVSEWEQPGSTNPYQAGDVVTFEGGIWRSDINNNVWRPDVTGWTRLDVVQTDEWQAGVSYSIGDIVTYQGVEYRCIQAHTAIVGWQPPNVPALWSVV